MANLNRRIYLNLKGIDKRYSEYKQKRQLEKELQTKQQQQKQQQQEHLKRTEEGRAGVAFRKRIERLQRQQKGQTPSYIGVSKMYESDYERQEEANRQKALARMKMINEKRQKTRRANKLLRDTKERQRLAKGSKSV